VLLSFLFDLSMLVILVNRSLSYLQYSVHVIIRCRFLPAHGAFSTLSIFTRRIPLATYERLWTKRFDEPAFLFSVKPPNQSLIVLFSSLYPDHALRRIKVRFIHSFIYFYDYLFNLPLRCVAVPPKTGLDRTGPRLDHGLGPAAVRSYATEKTGRDRWSGLWS
jgi:hypothetical protein